MFVFLLGLYNYLIVLICVLTYNSRLRKQNVPSQRLTAAQMRRGHCGHSGRSSAYVKLLDFHKKTQTLVCKGSSENSTGGTSSATKSMEWQ